MRAVRTIFIWLFLTVSVVLGMSWAQGETAGGTGQNKDLGVFMDQVGPLLEENNALKSEYERLKGELLKLREEIDGQKAEISRLKKNLAGKRVSGRRHLKEVEKRSTDIGLVLGGIEREESLQVLRLYELQYQKKELEAEMDLRKNLFRDIEKGYDKKLRGPKEEYDQNSARERELNRQVKEIQKENASYPREIERLEQENILLKDQIKALRKGERLQHKSEDVTKGQGEDGRFLGETIRRKENEKEELEEKIARLESRKDMLPGEGREAGSRDLLDVMQSLDQENQRLRSQIFSLRRKKDY